MKQVFRRRSSVIVLFFLSCIPVHHHSLYAAPPILQTLQKASESVVAVESEITQIRRKGLVRQKKGVGTSTYLRTGSGIIVDPDGIIATNAHTVIEASRIHIRLTDGRLYAAKPLLIDKAHDLCLLRTIGSPRLPALILADSTQTRLQSPIYSIGGSKLLKNSLSEGKLTGFGMKKSLNKTRTPSAGNEVQFFQVNIDLYQGDSGSPLFNASGEVIGIISAAVQQRGKTTFAVPSNFIRALLLQAQNELLPAAPR